jgi:phosphoglycolate phosphatase
MAAAQDGRRLVLWDIDHTLIETRGVGKELYAAAFEAVTGRRMEHPADPTGRTETAIFAETLEQHGIEASDRLQQRYAAELARQYERHAEELQTRGRALPGAEAALAALAEQPGIIQTVLTGNLRAVARIKLRVFGLDRYIDWKAGAYGEDASERAKLISVAQESAGEHYGVSFGPDNTVIVGDTAQDVSAAHEGGARIVAVASGREGVDELRDAGAEVVLPDLTNTAQVVEATTKTTRT